MRITDFEHVVTIYVDYFLNTVLADPSIDLEGEPEGFLQNKLRELTGIEDLEIHAPYNMLHLPCLIQCRNTRCPASAYESEMLINVPVDNQYRVICVCGSLPQVIAVFEDGFLQMNVGGVGPGGSGSTAEGVEDGTADI